MGTQQSAACDRARPSPVTGFFVYPIRGTTDFLFYQILAIMER
jgi:hypothetical protein